MRHLRLLLIEDDADSAEAMTMLLRVQHVDVDWVSSGWEALDLFRREPDYAVDVIMLDLMLPDVGGKALIERMRELTSLPRIIVHSAASLAATVQAGAQLHAMAVLRKPTDWMEMRKILEQCRVEVTQGARAG